VEDFLTPVHGELEIKYGRLEIFQGKLKIIPGRIRGILVKF
jgi:hypothetical protein